MPCPYNGATVFSIGGEHNDLAFFPGAFARGPYAGLFLQNQMQDAPFARGHGIESKWRMCFANALGGNACGKLQFFDAEGPVAAGIEADAAVELWIQPKPAQGDMFERLEQLGVAL